MEKCKHVLVERYDCKPTKPEFTVYFECSECAEQGESFRIKVPAEELAIKRSRALRNLQYHLDQGKPAPKESD